MPHREFIETYPLYKPLALQVPVTIDQLQKVSINMSCEECASNQTFVMTNEYWHGKPYSNFPSESAALSLEYVCVSCQSYERNFQIKVSDDRSSILKIGQYPSWDIRGDKNVERLLGEHKSYLRRGLICESHGYGIAAFAYYRRIVEETIDSLLDQIPQLLTGEELQIYNNALAETKKTRVTAEKIDLVKDLLPAVLRPEGMNPLRVLHETLSEGLHAETDDECLRSAEVVRSILTFLAAQIAAAAEARKSFTSGMRALLDRKAAKER